MLKFSEFIREFCTILITVWIFVTLPVTAILLLPLYMLRWSVSSLSGYFRPDLARMVSALSSLLAADTVYTRPRINIGIHLKLDTLRRTTKAEVVQIFKSGWIEERNAQGKLLFPEFQQFLTSWMGYSFWKWESKFEIENHVYSIEGNPVRPDQYLNRPFTEGQSPWELIIFETAGGGVDQVTVRFHHALADGYAIFKALTQLSTTSRELQYYESANNSNDSRTTLSKIRYFFKRLTFPIRAIYEIVQDQMEYQEECALDPPTYSQSLDKDLFLITTGRTSEKIRLTIVKDIKNKFGVSSSAVILAAVAGGIRNYLILNGLKVPKYIKTSVPTLKLPRNSSKLINKFSAVLVKLPIAEEDAVARLHEIELNFKRGRESTGAIATYLITVLLAGLPNFMTKHVLKRPWPPYLISPIVGPQEPVLIDNIQIEEINFTMACYKYGVLINITSYNQNLQLSISANKAVIPYNNLVDQLQNEIIQELHNLQSMDNGNQNTKFKQSIV